MEIVTLVSDIFQIIASIGSVVALVFVVKQLMLSTKEMALSSEQLKLQRKDFEVSNEREKRLKAIEIADDFRVLINNEIGFVTRVNRTLGITKILEDGVNKNLCHFDKKELKDVYGDDVEKLRRIQNNLSKRISDIGQIYLLSKHVSADEHAILTFFQIYSWDNQKIEEKFKNEEGEIDPNIKVNIGIDRNLDIFTITMLKNYYVKKILQQYDKDALNLLNKLEQFAMYLNNNIADEEVIYQSIHQTYIKTVVSMYFDIANMNDHTKNDKYFTNIITLYNTWNGISKKNQEDERTGKTRSKAPIHDAIA